MRNRIYADNQLRCSFCAKSEKVVGKLISNPPDHPRAYICDECIAICQSIIEDDQAEAAAQASHELILPTGRFQDHLLTDEFLLAAEAWALHERTGQAASDDLDRMRSLAAAMLAKP